MAERGAVNLVVVSSTLTPSAIQRETRLVTESGLISRPQVGSIPTPATTP